jgi:hypothetical protein
MSTAGEILDVFLEEGKENDDDVSEKDMRMVVMVRSQEEGVRGEGWRWWRSPN